MFVKLTPVGLPPAGRALVAVDHVQLLFPRQSLDVTVTTVVLAGGQSIDVSETPEQVALMCEAARSRSQQYVRNASGELCIDGVLAQKPCEVCGAQPGGAHGVSR